jgi:hypothetical protein
MDWFRYYTKTLESRKVQSLPPVLFKAWINLLCVARIFDGKILPEEAAYRLRCSPERLQELVEALHDRNLIDGPPWTPHDWDEHQCNSDSAAERMRAYRKRKRERNALRNSDGIEQIRADTEQNRTDTEEESYALTADQPSVVRPALPSKKANPDENGVGEFETWYAGYWNKSGKQDARKAFKFAREYHALAFLIEQTAAYRVRFEHSSSWEWRANMLPATFLRGKRWEDQNGPEVVPMGHLTPTQQAIAEAKQRRLNETH